MAEDAPATFEHGRRRRVMGTVRGMVPERYLLRNSLSVSSTSSMPCDKVTTYGPEYEAHFGAASVCSAPKLPRNLRSTSLCWP
jgi:hypothetical protein